MPIFLRALAAFSVILCLRPIAAWPNTNSREEGWEIQVGRERYADYMQRGEIVPPQSPLYRTIDPIGKAIAAVADREYFAPFHFILLNEQTPNAFSMPGGDVYVTTALLSFLKNRDELAGVLCHEVNHDIHHDMYDVFQATQGGRSPQDPRVIAEERAAEANADRAGAYTCAKAGFNPWGMVWNFRQYRQAMGVSNNGGVDHPSDEQREAELIALFREHRATFGRFSDDVASATPLARSQQVAQTQYSQSPRYPSQSQYSQQYPQYHQQYQQYPQQQYQQYPQQQYQQYPQQQYQQYPQQQYQQYPQQQYQQYPQQQYQQYPQQQYQQYPQQQYQQYPQPQQQRPPYPPPPLPPCYPGC
jgi:predicted Zn-dependent protease